MSIQGITASDFQTLNELKIQAKNDAEQALPAAAKQFEGIFLQSMLKSMRMSHHFLEDSSPFRGKNQETFQDMLDTQYASGISDTGQIGLATMLTYQLKKTANNTTDADKKDMNLYLPNLNKTQQPINLTTHAAVHSSKSQAPSSIDEFVSSIWPLAKQVASASGLDPKILMAQAALETGWGKFVAKDTDGSSSHNLFNIKSATDSAHNSVTVKTTEYIADTPIKMQASFRKYASVEHSFNDYVSLIKGNERYQQAAAQAANPEAYVFELSKAGYATDPAYSNKILSIYHGNELNQAIQRCELAQSI